MKLRSAIKKAGVVGALTAASLSTVGLSAQQALAKAPAITYSLGQTAEGCQVYQILYVETGSTFTYEICKGE